MTLTQQLKELADNSEKRHPGEPQNIMKAAITELEKTTILAKVTKTGDTFPDFSLPNATGELTALDTLLKKGKIVLTFYRGGWCPYCNLALKALQNALPEINDKGATLIAITPETPDNSLNSKEKNNLEFEILTDSNNDLARSLGLLYKLPENLTTLYNSFGINLLKSQGNNENELPIAATYIIDTDKKITYDYIVEDYKLRADPLAIIAAL
ncbi:alkyl hydroperoxide reductase [Tenacibaculum sp. Bg11-29]|uniref:peroxiredoxin-like family protein n=1 Tax=Tenacibaculum sp. Bg11-29 TaxID=2058306 RepID=UPI000C337B8C|nr:peroxiredoxin-like family protein [Tenacibaculum sp. Bg11-29]PKH49190.1 alkyl hydroperoxide reductase [Tenacibaculum sp. Bg11-29]